MRTNHNASGKPSLEGCVGLRYLFRQVLQATSPWVCGILTNDKNKDVNEYIRTNGCFACRTLIDDIEEYIGGHYFASYEVKLKRINRLKEFLLSIVNSGLLQEDALALVSDFIAAFDVSAIADAVTEQQKKIQKKEEKKD